MHSQDLSITGWGRCRTGKEEQARWSLLASTLSTLTWCTRHFPVEFCGRCLTLFMRRSPGSETEINHQGIVCTNKPSLTMVYQTWNGVLDAMRKEGPEGLGSSLNELTVQVSQAHSTGGHFFLWNALLQQPEFQQLLCSIIKLPNTPETAPHHQPLLGYSP